MNGQEATTYIYLATSAMSSFSHGLVSDRLQSLYSASELQVGALELRIRNELFSAGSNAHEHVVFSYR
jgi:hypothetical protein